MKIRTQHLIPSGSQFVYTIHFTSLGGEKVTSEWLKFIYDHFYLNDNIRKSPGKRMNS